MVLLIQSTVRILHGSRKIIGFASDSREYDNGCIMVFLIAGLDFFRIARIRSFAGSKTRNRISSIVQLRRFRTSVSGLFVRIVEFLKCRIEFESGFLQTLIKGRSLFGHFKRTRSRTPIGKINGVFSEHRDLASPFQRKSIVLVLQKSNSLFIDFLVDFVGLLKGIILVLIVRFIIDAIAENNRIPFSENIDEKVVKAELTKNIRRDKNDIQNRTDDNPHLAQSAFKEFFHSLASLSIDRTRCP